MAEKTTEQKVREPIHKASYKKTWDVGDFVEWSTYAGKETYDYNKSYAKVGKVLQVVTDGTVEGTDVAGTEDEPALLVEVYSQSGDGYVATGKQVAAKASAFWNISPLPVVITKAADEENDMDKNFAKRVAEDIEKALSDKNPETARARLQILKADAFALTEHEAGRTVEALETSKPLTPPQPKPDSTGMFDAASGPSTPDPDNGVPTTTPNQAVSSEHSFFGEGKGKSVGPGDSTSGAGSLPTKLATHRDVLVKSLGEIDGLLGLEEPAKPAEAKPAAEPVAKAADPEEIEKGADEDGGDNFAWPDDITSSSFMNGTEPEKEELTWGKDGE